MTIGGGGGGWQRCTIYIYICIPKHIGILQVEYIMHEYEYTYVLIDVHMYMDIYIYI